MLQKDPQINRSNNHTIRLLLRQAHHQTTAAAGATYFSSWKNACCFLYPCLPPVLGYTSFAFLWPHEFLFWYTLPSNTPAYEDLMWVSITTFCFKLFFDTIHTCALPLDSTITASITLKIMRARSGGAHLPF